VSLPEVVELRTAQDLAHQDHAHIEDVAAGTMQALGDLGDLIRAGQRVAIAVGSRGIADLAQIVATTVAAVRQLGAEPFVVPAMGSHGGATDAGQLHVLAAMGVTAQSVGAPLDGDMRVEELGSVRVSNRDIPVRYSTTVLAADATLLISRVKPHTSFRGRYESGMVKMAAIGLGKQQGAEACHARGADELGEAVAAVGLAALRLGNVVAGLAILENAGHQVVALELVPVGEIGAREPALLQQAWDLYPSLPFSELDVLVLDQIGKDISGTGFDTNVVGRFQTPKMHAGAERRTPSVASVVALGLSAATGGNANGMGLVDVTTRRLFERLSFAETYPNALTSTNTAIAKVPLVMDSDLLAIQAAIRTCRAPAAGIRFARIRDTLHLGTAQVSTSVAAALEGQAGVEIVGPPRPLAFDERGNLLALDTGA
jgi:hypothetical protein